MANLDLRVNLRGFDNISRTLEQVRTRNRRLVDSFNRNREALRRLNGQLGDISAYRRQQDALRQTGRALEDTRARMQRIQQQLSTPAVQNSARQMQRLSEQYRRASLDVARLESAQGREQQRLVQLSSRMREAGINTRRLSEEERRLRHDAERTNNALQQQSERLRRVAERAQLRDQRLASAANASMAGYVGLNAARRAGHILASPVSEYMAQEQASADLKVTMMRADGSFGAFEEINRQAKDLGKVLPGTTQDFINLAKALKAQGVKDGVLTGGGLQRAAELSVLMNMGQEEGGTFAARMIEAHGLNPADLQKAADMTQRAYYAFGLKKEDMAESMKYYAPTVNALGLTGNDNYQTLLAIQGMAARQGLEGSMFGTNFSAMVSRLSKGPKMLADAKRGMKAEARDILQASGVEFEFFDKAGKFKGLEAMVAEMEKLHIITRKFGEESALLVAKELFGEEAARPALLLAQQGSAGLQQALADMREQADMQSRITEKTSTLAAAFEQLGGVWGMLKGIIGESLREPLLQLAETMQGFIENTLQPFLEKHQGFAKGVMIAGALMTALAAIGGVLLLVFAGLKAGYAIFAFIFGGMGSLLRGVLALLLRFGTVLKLAGIWLWRFAIAAGQTALAALRSLIAGLASLAVALGKGIIAGVTMLGNAIAWLARGFLLLSRAVLTNPIVLAIAAIVAAGWWLYNNWDNVTGFVRDRWQALTEWWNNTPIGQKIIDIFNAPLNFLATLGETFFTLLVEAGKRVIVAIFGWDVYNTMVKVFSEAIDVVVSKINGLIAKLKEAWQAFKELIGMEEKSILARTDLGPQTAREKSRTFHHALQENARKLNSESRATGLEAYRKANPQLDATLRMVEQHNKKGSAVAPTVRKPQASATQNINIHINADGMGNKEAAALIGAEVKKEMAMLDRKQKAAARSAFYDAHA